MYYQLNSDFISFLKSLDIDFTNKTRKEVKELILEYPAFKGGRYFLNDEILCDRINKKNILSNQEWVDTYKELLPWHALCKKIIPEQFQNNFEWIDRYAIDKDKYGDSRLAWLEIGFYEGELSEAFIRRYFSYLAKGAANTYRYKGFFANHHVPEDLLYENRNTISKDCWYTISEYQHLSPKMIEQLYMYLDWESVIRYQKLTDELVFKFYPLMNLWYLRTRQQHLSEGCLNWANEHIAKFYPEKYEKPKKAKK